MILNQKSRNEEEIDGNSINSRFMPDYIQHDPEGWYQLQKNEKASLKILINFIMVHDSGNCGATVEVLMASETAE